MQKTGSSPTEYFYFGGQLLAMRDASGTWADRIYGHRIYGPGGALATVPGTQGGQPTYRISDHLGTLSYTLTPAGTILGRLSSIPSARVGATAPVTAFSSPDTSGIPKTLVTQRSTGTTHLPREGGFLPILPMGAIIFPTHNRSTAIPM